MASDPFPDCKRGVWKQKYRPDPAGKWVSVTLGSDPRLKSARPPAKPPQFVIDRAAEFAEIEYRAKHGLGVAPSRAKGLAAYVESAVAAQALNVQPGSSRQLRRHADRFVAFCLARGINTIQGVTAATCRDFLEELSGTMAATTMKTAKGYISGVWTRAVDDGLIAANPWCSKAARLKVKPEPSDPVFWSREEIAAIVAACDKPHWRDLALFLANTGIRISTALAMEWDWIDWSAGVIKIGKAEAVKTRYAHATGRVARDILTRRRFAKGTSPLVFPNPLGAGGRIPYDSAADSIHRAIRKAGVPVGTPHDLRHSYARLLILAGVPVTVVQSQLGHTTLAMTQRYIRVGEQTATRFVEDIGFGEA